MRLGKARERLSDSEIEDVFIEALCLAFDGEKQPTDLDVGQVLTEFGPLSKLMAEQIAGLRSCAVPPLQDHNHAKEQASRMSQGGIVPLSGF